MKKLISVLWLGLYLLRHFARRVLQVFTRHDIRQGGYASFCDNYRDDGIIVLTPDEMRDFGQFSRCIRCGLCDTFCANTQTLSAGFDAFSLLASTHSRNLAEADYALSLASRFTSCEGCAHCFDRCPTQVPIHRLVARITRLGRARNAPAALQTPP